VLLEHYEALLLHYGTDAGVRMARKHLGWYSRGLPGSAEFRAAVMRLAEPAAVIRLVDAFYDRLAERPGAADPEPARLAA
jgi:tRNA-dihydrouridine synthase B